MKVEPRSELSAGARGVADFLTVAVVGLSPEDQDAFRKILGCAQGLPAPDCQWKVQSKAGVEAVLEAVRREPVAIVVWDRDGMADAWKDLLDRLAAVPQSPLLIVASRLADDRLWAEALNLGAYDVMFKPFDAVEVARIAGLAGAQWRQRRGGSASVMRSVA